MSVLAAMWGFLLKMWHIPPKIWSTMVTKAALWTTSDRQVPCSAKCQTDRSTLHYNYSDFTTAYTGWGQNFWNMANCSNRSFHGLFLDRNIYFYTGRINYYLRNKALNSVQFHSAQYYVTTVSKSDPRGPPFCMFYRFLYSNSPDLNE